MNLDLTNLTAPYLRKHTGIGKATAIELSKLGASIILVSRNEKFFEKVKEELSTEHKQQHA